jgi:hypothetical protein
MDIIQNFNLRTNDFHLIKDDFHLTKNSPSIMIPTSSIDSYVKSYDTYNNSIPKYGSYSKSYNKLDKQTKDIKYSESSDVPNNPFGKSPPNNSYFKTAYLNYLANNNLKNNSVEH